MLMFMILYLSLLTEFWLMYYGGITVHELYWKHLSVKWLSYFHIQYFSVIRTVLARLWSLKRLKYKRHFISVTLQVIYQHRKELDLTGQCVFSGYSSLHSLMKNTILLSLLKRLNQKLHSVQEPVLMEYLCISHSSQWQEYSIKSTNRYLKWALYSSSCSSNDLPTQATGIRPYEQLS